MSTQREVLEQAAPAVLSATQMRALQDARTTAMHWTAKARVPECGEFGRIAQDLDWLVNELAAPQHEVQEPVAWSVFDKRTKKHWYTNESKYTTQHCAKEYSHQEPDNTLSMVVVPLYTHPAPAVMAQLVDALAGLIDFIEIDNLKIDQDALRIARAALAAAKKA